MSCPFDPLNEGVLPDGFCAFELPVTVDQARSVIAIDTTRVLVLERGTNAVVLLGDSDQDGVADTNRLLISANRLNHGLALHDGYIYASSDTMVYRWPYTYDSFTNIGAEEIVINNINADGQGGAPFGHTTRTLAFDSAGRLYVSVGSNQNVDPTSFRSRIRRFSDLTPSLFPIDFLAGEIFADGLRNEVGLAFDRYGVLWGVENGADRLERADLGGGSITNDNPAEELNRFPEEIAGSHFGYPYCWTEYLLPEEFGMGRGTTWAWPSFLVNGDVTDEDCRNNYLGPEISMQAHSAPLGITFYKWKNTAEMPVECEGGAFPKEMDGFAFIAFHGSWNRDVPTGYKVVYIAMDETGKALGQPIDLLAHSGDGARWNDGFRPVDVDFDTCGRLLVSSDGTRTSSSWSGSKIVRIEYHGEFTDSKHPSQSPSQHAVIPSPVVTTPPTSTNTPSMSVTEGLSSAPSPPPFASTATITPVSCSNCVVPCVLGHIAYIHAGFLLFLQLSDYPSMAQLLYLMTFRVQCNHLLSDYSWLHIEWWFLV